MSNCEQRYIQDTIQSCFCTMDSMLQRSRNADSQKDAAHDICALVTALGDAFSDSLDKEKSA